MDRYILWYRRQSAFNALNITDVVITDVVISVISAANGAPSGRIVEPRSQ
jgi:hypothetical protein